MFLLSVYSLLQRRGDCPSVFFRVRSPSLSGFMAGFHPFFLVNFFQTLLIFFSFLFKRQNGPGFSIWHWTLASRQRSLFWEEVNLFLLFTIRHSAVSFLLAKQGLSGCSKSNSLQHLKRNHMRNVNLNNGRPSEMGDRYSFSRLTSGCRHLLFAPD